MTNARAAKANSNAAKAAARAGANAAKAARIAEDRETSKDGVEVAKHLMSAMLYASSAWWSRSPELLLTFRDPDKGLLRSYTTFVVTYVNKALQVGNLWTPLPMFSSLDPAAVMQFCAAKSGGFVVSVSVAQSEDVIHKGAMLGEQVQLTDRGVRFWDIRDESRRLNSNSATSKNLARAAAQALLTRGTRGGAVGGRMSIGLF